MFRLNDLLNTEGVDPTTTAICLHTPRERKLARLLPFFAQAEPRMLEVFQSTHNGPATSTLKRCNYMVSFVRIESGALALAGVFQQQGQRLRSRRELRALPEVDRMIREFGALTEFDEPEGDDWVWFDLVRTKHLASYVGRLQIQPRLSQAYMRRAHKLDPEIVALSRENILAPSAPDWRSFIVTAPEVRTLPSHWAARLREWCGVYLITDETDGARYVGSAYGEENLLARWRAHVSGARGLTEGLKARDPATFRFSILELLAPNSEPSEVVAVENSWKERLHTRQFGVNKN